jgi:hypothetical protein
MAKKEVGRTSVEQQGARTSEAKNPFASPRFSWWIVGFAACYVGVLSIAGTIALRNVSLFMLLVLVAWQFIKVRPTISLPLPVILWAAYLFVFPWISSDTSVALTNLAEQWGRGVLAMVAGAGVATLVSERIRGNSLRLGVVSSSPLVLHLGLVVWVMLTSSDSGVTVPWGYWGVDDHHANLGYAACQSVILLTAALVGWKNTCKPLALGLILVCLLSTTVARSRAGFVFSLVAVVLIVASAYLARSPQVRVRSMLWGAGVLLVGGTLLGVAMQHDPRWKAMEANVSAGLAGDAVRLQCEGTTSIEPTIRENYGPVAEAAISSVRNGDGARVVLFRAGIAIALQTPWGSDGSRQAYQKLLLKTCGVPELVNTVNRTVMAHAHDGWIDTALAIGWIGVVLYAAVLFYFFKQGVQHLRQSVEVNEWALVLVALPVFWGLRAFTDSVFRDHMFEMQGFVLAYAYYALQVHKQVSTAPTTT